MQKKLLKYASTFTIFYCEFPYMYGSTYEYENPINGLCRFCDINNFNFLADYSRYFYGFFN